MPEGGNQHRQRGRVDRREDLWDEDMEEEEEEEEEFEDDDDLGVIVNRANRLQSLETLLRSASSVSEVQHVASSEFKLTTHRYCNSCESMAASNAPSAIFGGRNGTKARRTKSGSVTVTEGPS